MMVSMHSGTIAMHLQEISNRGIRFFRRGAEWLAHKGPTGDWKPHPNSSSLPPKNKSPISQEHMRDAGFTRNLKLLAGP